MGGGSQQPEIFTIPSKPAAGKRVEFVARAADPARTVRMEIWVGRQRVRTCNDDVCRFVGGPFKAGTVLYAAVAIDKAGNKVATPFKKLVIQSGDTTPPVLRAFHKPANPRVGQKVTVFANAKDTQGAKKSGVHKIEIRVGDKRKMFPGEKASFTTGPHRQGSVNYEVTAFDRAGNKTWSGRKRFVVTAEPSKGNNMVTGKISGQRKFVKQVGVSNLDQPSTPRTARVDDNGNFRIRELPDGRYRVFPIAGGKFDVISDPRNKDVRLTGNQKATANFKIKGIMEG